MRFELAAAQRRGEGPLDRRVSRLLQLQQLAKLLDRESSITNDTAESKSVDGIMPGDSEYAHAIGHDDVFALTRDREPTRELRRDD